MKIKVIVPVSTDLWNPMIKEAYEKYKDPNTEIDIINIHKGPESIEQIYDEAWAALPTLLEAEKAEKEGYDAVIDYCFGDPALEALKEAIKIPVVGLNEPSIHLASLLGRRFSIIGVGGKEAKGLMHDKVAHYGLDKKLAAIRITDIRVLDIKKEFKKLVEALAEEGRKAIEEDGAEVLVLGCGSLLNIAEILQKRLNVPVIDSGLAALKIAEDLVKLDLSHSKKAHIKPFAKKRIP
ncbi:MAG: aspartate/glutamate racemase family protein [Candidatus Bathycorpusculaceae bacterium]